MDLTEMLCAFMAWIFLIISPNSDATLIAALMLSFVFVLGLLKYWRNNEYEKLRQYLRNHRDWRAKCLIPNCPCRE
jgi:hypothetical protein